MKVQQFRFSSIRNDWYFGNSVVPRAILRCIRGERRLVFAGFPRQWIPMLEWFGIPWQNTVLPTHYVPIISDLGEDEVVKIVKTARKERSLRTLVETVSHLDPILSDCLYIVDNSLPLSPSQIAKDAEYERSPSKRLLLNGWQSYGRVGVRSIELELERAEPKHSQRVVLPCSLRRPYDKSRTHRKIYLAIEKYGLRLNQLDKIVITSLGVLPEQLWALPQVLAYDAGVPDVYRVLRLARKWFGRAGYEVVFDCLQFEPYRDVLRIIQSEGSICQLERIKIPAQRHFYMK